MVSKLVRQPRDVDGEGVLDPIAGCDREPWGWTNGNGGGNGNGNAGGNGNGPCGNNGNGNGGGSGPEVFEADQYFYHPDHLGSSSYVTDVDGEIFQHLEYFPFGETWVEESSNTQRTPYLFTGKELDEQTGLYYFGARYYDPRTSVWQSPDPILASYMGGGTSGGVFAPRNLSLFSYAGSNPVRAKDPDGRILDTILDVGFIIYDLGVIIHDEVTTGGQNRTENLLALGADTGGLFVPFATGGGVVVRSADDVAGGVASTVRRNADEGADGVRRGDTRAPDEIYQEGLQPHAPGSNTSLEDYVDFNEPSNFVGTTKNPATGDTRPGSPGEFATNGGQQPGYIYDLDYPKNGIDVNEAYPGNPFRHENEVAVPGGISPSCIRGCTPVGPDGAPIGDYIPNPNYRGGD